MWKWPSNFSLITKTATRARLRHRSDHFAGTSIKQKMARRNGIGSPTYPGGAVTGKVSSSELAENLALIAHAGHPCGEDFVAAPFLLGTS